VKRVDDWLKQAEKDLEKAEYARRGKYYELWCSLFQQCAGKAVKALLQSSGVEGRGHSVTHLPQEAPNEIVECALYLDRRYAPRGIQMCTTRATPLNIILKRMPRSV